MIGFFKSLGRALYGALSLVGRTTLFFVVMAFGRFQWQAPWWLQKIGNAFCSLKRRIPARTALIAFCVLALLGGAGEYARRWYASQPKPYTVAYVVTPPPLTDYAKKPIVGNSVMVRFANSVAPLKMIGEPVTVGIVLSPKIEGEWRWASDRSLAFAPVGDWPIDQSYRVDLDREKLLAANVLLDKYSFDFKTAPFQIRDFSARLYEDPAAPDQKKLVATLSATHPLDRGDFPKHALIELTRGLGYLDKSRKPDLQFFFSDDGLKAYVHSAFLETPLENSRAVLTLNEGVRAEAGGNATEKPMRAGISVTGLYQLTFGTAEIKFVNDAQGEPEPVLMFESSSPISDENIQNQVVAWQLPARKDRGSWAESEITEALLDKSVKIPLTHIPGEGPQNSLHAFKFDATPGRQLYVRVNANVKSIGGYLSRDSAVVFDNFVPSYPTLLSFLSEGALLSLNGERNLGIMGRGVANAKVEIARILPRQLHHLVNQLDGNFVRPDMYEDDLNKLVERMRLDVKLSADNPAKTVYGHVNLSPYLDGKEERRGIFVLRINPGDRDDDRTLVSVDNVRDVRFIVVTDLGIIAKKNVDASNEVFVQSISGGGPVADALVEVYGVNGLPVASARTDATGRVHFNDLSLLTREKRPLMYVVSKGADQSFLPIAKSARQLDFSRFRVGGIFENGRTDQLKAFVFSDRGLYRPGETVHLGMIVRSQNWSANLEGAPVKLTIADPRGQVIDSQAFNLSATAFESVDFTSSPNAPAGTYTAEMTLADSARGSSNRLLGSVEFMVRDFEPDRMKVTVSLSPTPVEGWIKPDQVEARVTAMHLFGAPAADRRVTTSINMIPALSNFKGYEDYRFYLGNSLDENLSKELEESVTGENGEAVLELDLGWSEAKMYNLQILARVFEAGSGRNVAADAHIAVSPEDYLLGVKTTDPLNYVAKDAVRRAQWVAIGPDLEKVAVDGLTVELVEIRYVSVLVKQSDGTYRYESRRKDRIVESKPFAVGETGFEQTLKTDEPGSFIVNIRKDEQLLNQLSYNVGGNANAARSLDRNAELQLRLNKDVYQPGDEIEISVQAPYVGSGLITIERDKVYNHVWFRTDSTSSVQRIRIPEGIEGNAYVNVQFVRSSESDEIFMSPLSYGVAAFNISLDARRTGLGLETPKQVEPGDRVQIKVTLDRPSKVVVYGVDQGILQVARYQTPMPLEHFFQKRALEVSTSQILDLILPEFSNLMRVAVAGGDGEGALAAHLNPFKRKNRPPVAWWSGVLSLPTGETVLSWQVPDYFNGKLHFFAVAVDQHHIGVTQSYVDVRGPVVISPNVPAFVAPGDQVRVTASVFSNLESAATVRMSLETSEGLKLVASDPVLLDIEAGREGVAIFDLDIGETLGSADLQFVAELPDGKRVRLGETISVRPAIERRVHLDLGMFTKKTYEIKPERDLYPELRKVTVGLSGSPLVWGAGLQDYLENYGYSCTEQLVSKAMPVLIWGDAASDRSDASFAAAINILRQRQNSSGGFGVWAATPYSDPYVSLYAADFLLEAKERGFLAPESLIGNANRYISNIAKDPGDGLDRLRNRAYAVYLLTRQGIVASNQLSAIREQLETYFEPDVWQKDIVGAYMAASYKLLKQDREANALIKKQPWLLMGQEWRSDGRYRDPLTHDSEYLNLLVRHFPDMVGAIPPEMLVNLGHRLRERRYNSLSSALVIRALGNYEKLAQKRFSVSATSHLADQKTRLLEMSGQPPRADVAMDVIKMIFDKSDGAAPAFYALSEAGYDKGTPDKPIMNGLEIIHDYLDLEGKPIDRAKVGEEFLVRIRLRSSDRDSVEQVAIVDLLPGGVEPVYNQPPARSDEESDDGEEGYEGEEEEETSWVPPVGETNFSDWTPDFIDLRDDRVVLYGTASEGVGTFAYRVRAVNEGTFVTSPAYAESMYEPTVQGRGMAGRLTIEAP